jgi:hypothetical protein
VRSIVAGWLSALLVFPSTAPELPAELRRLAGSAASLPAEFEADALLQIVESRGSLDAALKKRLIEQAFMTARQAQYPYPRVAVRGIDGDTRQAFLANALAMNLDRLSLETRAVRVMLAFDPISGGRLFQEIQKPAIPAGTCSDALLPRVDDYYDNAAAVISRGFTPREVSRQEPLALLLRIVAGVNAPYEVGPAARMILNATLSPLQFEAALNAFTVRLESVVSEDRSFTETGTATQLEIGALASRASSLGISQTLLARSYRKYLTVNYSKARCAGSAPARIANLPSTGLVDWFNGSDLRGDLPVIDIKEVTVNESAGRLKLDGYWSGPDSQKILIEARALRTAPNGMTLSLEQRSTSEWNEQLQDFLAQLNQWEQGSDESELDFFNEKAVVYQSLIDVCPPGDGRQRLIAAFVDFLGGSNILAQKPVDWFWHAQNLYRRLRQSGDDDAAKLMTAYKGAGNLMMEVYARLNER